MRSATFSLLIYAVSIILALIIHYFAFSKIVMHSTLHVLLGIVLLYLISLILIFIFGRKTKGGKK
jgi:hypothetical protein